MKKIIFILLILTFPFIAYNKVNFYKGSLNDVKIAAATQGKLYFVDFYASYCLPCKLMDQTTFMDEELGNYVAQSYIPLKLNIDAFDAYEIRADYEVQELPTIMIFSSSGVLLDTYKGSLTATALSALLKKHDLPKNRELVTPPKKETFADETTLTASKPMKPTKPKIEPSLPLTNNITAPPKPIKRAKPITNNTNTTNLNIPTVSENSKPNKPSLSVTNNSATPSKPIKRTEPIANTSTNSNLNVPTIIKNPKPNRPVITNPTSNDNSKPTAPVIISPPKISTFQPSVKKIIPTNSVTSQIETKKGNGLYEFTSKKHPSSGYGIQIGLFAEYGNVLTEVEKIQAKFPTKKVLVHITEFNGKTVYRVMIGTFTSYALARNYLPQIKASGFEAFIKDLSTLN